MGIWKGITSLFNGDKRTINKFNEAFYWGTPRYTENDDNDLKKYIDLAYNINPTVYSVVSQISDKVISIPYFVKKIEDKDSNNKYGKLLKAVNYAPSISQSVKLSKLELKALSEGDYDMPFDKPNPSQTWDEFFKLSDIFYNLTGNVYWYKQCPEDGLNKDRPTSVYCLPSHLIEIVLKNNANLLVDENPIDYFMLEDGTNYVKFGANEVVHISTGNPNFGLQGEHLYGQSPLRSAWKNVEASNKGLDLNINTLKNGGVFGFIHSKGTPLQSNQAQELKERLKEMNKSPEDLSRIAGISAEIGFTRLSLSADELKPFEYLKYNEKQICNVFGWSDTLLNNDDGGKYDKQVSELKRVLTNTVLPQVKLLETAFNKEILQKIRGYEDKCLYFDYKELPELQEDLETMSKYVIELVRNGIMNRTIAQSMLRLPIGDDKNLEEYTVQDDIMSLEQALLPNEDLTL